MRVLVTGGAGYIGSISVEALVAAGHTVVVLDDLSTGHPGAVPRGVPLATFSYAETEAVRELIAQHEVEAILHCGARSLVGESMTDPARYYRENVAGGLGLLEAARRSGVERFVFSSSAAVYGTPSETPIPESAPLDPVNAYGETKRTFEGALRWYGQAYGLRSVSLRYFNAAGASAANGEDHDPETHLVPNILRAAEGEGEVTLFGADYPTPDGTCVRDYIDVRDLASAHLLALEATAAPLREPGADADGTPNSLACNLGNGSGYSVLEVLRAAERVVGRPIPSRRGPRRPGDPPVLVATAERAVRLLGWTPRHDSLDDMIGSAWEWRRRNPHGYGTSTGTRGVRSRP